MPWNRERPLDRWTRTPRVSMAAFSIRLLPGGWELVWHGVDYDVLRGLVTDGALADDDGLVYVTERGSASLSDYLSVQVTAEELPELEAFADEFDEFDLEVKAALTAWQQAARAQDDEAQMAAVERWLDVDSRLREAANRSEGASRHFGRSSIGIVGASTNPTRIGSRVLSNLRRHGYAGDVFVINSRYPEVNGVKCYPSLTSLDEVPDVALLAVDADASLDVLTEYAELGGRNAVLLASGFESGEEGMRRSERLKELARDHGLNVAGPNSQGLWSVGHKMVLAFGSEADRDEVRLGAVAVIAQSGSLGGAVTRRLLDLQVGVSYFISTGDGTVTDTADYLSQVIEDAQVRVVALYLEGTRDGRRLGQAIRAAHQRGVRVVVLPGGMSAAGRSATSSHTGRIITRPRLLTQLLEQDGVIVARTVRELVAVTRTLALSPLELPRAPKVAVLGISGGMLALLVDACEGRLDLADFSDATLGRLRATLPDYTSPKNPVDVTGTVVENEAL